MALTVHFEDGPLADKPISFDDTVACVKIGRDSEQCQVVLPANQVVVGGEHCSIVHQGGNVYNVCPTPTHHLLINGEEVTDTLPVRFDRSVKLQLGRSGPQLVVDVHRTTKLPPTTDPAHLLDERELIEREKARRRKLTFGAAGFGLALSFVVAMVLSRFDNRIAVLERETVDLKSLTDQELTLLRTVQAASGRVDRGTEAQFDEHVRQAKRSIYLVVEVSAHDHVEPIATAWVINRDRGHLATNAHVAKDVHPPRDDSHFEVRRVADDGQLETHIVQGTDIHPGYDAFAELCKGYEPSEPTQAGTPSEINLASQACDVALLMVDLGKPLAPNLVLAGPTSLDGLEAPALVASLGFPLEGIGPSVVNPHSPTPTVQVAHLTAVTDYFGRETATKSDRLLIQHAAPGTRGSSGSPILNDKGKVIAIHSSGIPIGKTDQGDVICTPANVFFAHRVDLAVECELPNPARAELQTQRAKSWARAIQSFPCRKDINNQLAIDDLREDVCTAAAARGEFDARIASCFPIEFGGASIPTQAAVGSQSEACWRVPGPGRFVLFALDPQRQPCQISSELMRDRISVGKLSGTPFDLHPWLSYLTFDAVDQLDDALIRVQSAQPVGTLQVQVLQVSRERRSPDKLRAQLVDLWLAGPSCGNAGYKMAQVVTNVVEKQELQTDLQGRSGCGCRVHVALREPGCYLLTVVTKKGSPIGISLSGRSANSSSQPAARSWLACPIEAESPRKLTATILGAEPDECEAVLFRASR